MSYRRSFSRKVTVRYSGSVSYPPSQHGGSVSYSGSASETVIVNVEVDTDPFDSEVHDMKGHLDLLTDSVVATKAAHVLSIGKTSKKIGDTIIAGFFKTVRSDISQQIAELKTRADALLLQLKKLADRCADKKRQMGEDYQRTSSRYTKIFTDLNNELENRIYSLDEPVFHVIRTMDDMERLASSSDMVPTVAVAAGENARLHSVLSVDIAKVRAAEAINSGKIFLESQLATDIILDSCLRSGGEGASICAPFVMMEAVSSPGIKNDAIYVSPLLKDSDLLQLADKAKEQPWATPIPEDEEKAISEYYKSEVVKTMNNAVSEHDRRVATLTARMYDLSKTTTVK